MVKSPQSPPSFDELVTKINAEKAFRLGRRIDRRYLHWDQIRHRDPPEGLTLEEWWFSVKLPRMTQRRFVPLVDHAGNHFSFTMPDGVLERLHRIDSEARGNIALPDIVTNRETRDRYIVRSLMEEAVTSSQMEGAETSRPVALEMLRTGRKPADKNERMIFNNFAAIQHIHEWEDKLLTPDMVLELHRIVCEKTLDDSEDAGRLQKPGEKRIGVYAQLNNELLHRPPPAEELPDRLKKMCAFANAETDRGEFVHPIIRAIVLHFWLAYDHPFVDGNGRTARILFYWLMSRSGYWLFEYVSISRILNRAQAKYGRAFLYTETDDNDLTYFILHQLDVMEKAIQELQEYLAEKIERTRELEHVMHDVGDINHRQIALLSHALRHPHGTYTINSHKRSHRTAYATARSDLKRLAELGLLREGKRGRALVYFRPRELEKKLANLGDAR